MCDSVTCVKVKLEDTDHDVGASKQGKEKQQDCMLRDGDFLPLEPQKAAHEKFPPGCSVLICEYHDYGKHPELKLEEGALSDFWKQLLETTSEF